MGPAPLPRDGPPGEGDTVDRTAENFARRSAGGVVAQRLALVADRGRAVAATLVDHGPVMVRLGEERAESGSTGTGAMRLGTAAVP